MSILASELARMAGPKCHETVSTAVQRWEDKLRERVRLEMALKLADDSGWGRQVQRVGVTVSDGLPVELVLHEQDLTTDLVEIAGMFRPDLLSFQRAATALHQLLDRLSSLDSTWAARSPAEKEKITSLEGLSATLLDLAARSTFKEILKKIEGDVLGAYFPRGKKPKSGGAPVIEIYWTVVGAVAKVIDVDVEGLTITILAHELTHAYSHLGADTDGNRWGDQSFCDSEVSIKEGIAQYYTEKIVRWLGQRHIEGPRHAYEQLLKIQGAEYRIHEKWTKEYSPESVRAAVIECRNSNVTVTTEFVELMEMAKHRLERRPRERDLFQ